MSDPAQAEPENSEEARERRSLIDRAKAFLGANLPAAKLVARDSLIAADALTAVAMALANPASGLSTNELLKLLQGLGVNWLATLVLEWRARGGKIDATAEARKIDAQLSDGLLRTLYRELDLIKTTLASIKDAGDRDRWAEEVLKRGLVSREDLAAVARNASITISGSVYNSAIINVAGDMSNVTVHIPPGDERLVAEAIAYKRRLAASEGIRSSELLSEEADALGATGRVALKDVYTPLTVLFERHQAVDGAADVKDGTGQDNEPVRGFGLGVEARTSSKEPTSLIAVLSDTPRAVVLGAPGSGKSTVLNYLTLGLCDALGDDPEFAAHWTHGALLPLPVTLRRFVAHAHVRGRLAGPQPDLALFDYVQQQLIAPYAPHLAEELRTILTEHGGVLMLDGLDEVPSAQRAGIERAIELLCATFPRMRCVVTCRTYSYRDASERLKSQRLPFADVEVLPFDLEQAQTFVRKCYAEIGRLLDNDRTTRANKLANALASRPRLLQLGSSPLLLMLMVSLHNYAEGRDLPEDRWELMRQAVNLLLGKWRDKKIDAAEGGLDAETDLEVQIEERIRQLLTGKKEQLIVVLGGVAYQAQAAMPLAGDAGDELLTADVPEQVLCEALYDMLKSDPVITPDLVSRYLRNRIGLIQEVSDTPPRKHKFPHRFIQEYLAAVHVENRQLLENPDQAGQLLLQRLDADWTRWREVVALAALMKDEGNLVDYVDQLLDGADAQTDSAWRRVALAVDIVADKVGIRPDRPAQRFKKRVSAAIEDVRTSANILLATPQALTARERNDMARRLLELPLTEERDRLVFRAGDTRLAVCANLATPEGLAHYLAEGFVLLRPKPFRMLGTYETQIKAPLLVAKTQLTWAQFEPFVEQGGYADDRLWTAAGREWRGKRTQPRYWDSLAWRVANHPANGLSWYESMAWCAWLTRELKNDGIADGLKHRLGLSTTPVCRLLTEVEWLYAARGDTLRRYPWKRNEKEEWDAGDELRCNMGETGLGHTSVAGLFPDGSTPEGIADLSGNVWDWALTVYDGDPLKGSNLMDATGSRVLRGGAFNDFRRGVSATNRRRYAPYNIHHFVGCRVCLSPLGASQL